MDIPQYAFVIARGPNSNVKFRAMYLRQDSMGCHMQSLVWDGQDVAEFDTYAEARKIVEAYNNGPDCGNVRSAVWQNQRDNWGWDVTEVYGSRSYDEDREDFHADG